MKSNLFRIAVHVQIRNVGGRHRRSSMIRLTIHRACQIADLKGLKRL
jgi:hypothetical protein